MRDALKAAIEALRTMPDIDEPSRDALHLDHDREGIPGSPELVRTILEKIEKADVVVVCARSHRWLRVRTWGDSLAAGTLRRRAHRILLERQPNASGIP